MMIVENLGYIYIYVQNYILINLNTPPSMTTHQLTHSLTHCHKPSLRCTYSHTPRPYEHFLPV